MDEENFLKSYEMSCLCKFDLLCYVKETRGWQVSSKEGTTGLIFLLLNRIEWKLLKEICKKKPLKSFSNDQS